MIKRKKEIEPNWRPNFVNEAKLPDIKVVRTGFAINFVAVAFFLITGGLLLQKEYSIRSTRQTIALLEQRIEKAIPDNEANLKRSQEFVAAAGKIADIEKFFIAPFAAHEFLIELGKFRPTGIELSSISFNEANGSGKTNKLALNYQITLVGEVGDLTLLDQFKGSFVEWDFLKLEGYKISVTESVQPRSATTDLFPFSLSITLEPSA